MLRGTSDLCTLAMFLEKCWQADEAVVRWAGRSHLRARLGLMTPIRPSIEGPFPLLIMWYRNTDAIKRMCSNQGEEGNKMFVWEDRKTRGIRTGKVLDDLSELDRGRHCEDSPAQQWLLRGKAPLDVVVLSWNNDDSVDRCGDDEELAAAGFLLIVMILLLQMHYSFLKGVMVMRQTLL